MNKELIMVLLPGISWICFALGGTQISKKISGQKWIRRYLLPAIYLMFCLMIVSWWQSLITAALAVLAFCMGYGDSASWLKKALVGLLYGLITIAIGLSYWNIVTPLMFLLLFKLSNTKITANLFVWKICEGFFGLFVGIELAYLLMGLGLIW